MKKFLMKAVPVVVIALIITGLIYYFFNLSNGKKAPPPDGVNASVHNNETEWIIHEIVSDITGMICYKKYAKNFSPDDVSISIEHSGNFDYDV